jgi:hypothetical protein
MPLRKPNRAGQRSRGSKGLDFARRLGILRQRNHLVQTELALDIARLALGGQIDAEDANAIYLAYRFPEGGEDQGASAIRVQASKLRQIIKLVKRDGPRGNKLLTAVVRLHKRLPPHSKFGCYDAMVLVARRQLQKSKALSNIEVHQIALSLRKAAAP